MKISRLKNSIKHKLNRFFFLGGGGGLGECIALVSLRIILRTWEQVKKNCDQDQQKKKLNWENSLAKIYLHWSPRRKKKLVNKLFWYIMFSSQKTSIVGFVSLYES